jgi:hypothetical protein
MDAEHHDVLPDLPAEVPPDLLARTEARLAGMDELPVADHPDVYERVHADLLDALADTDGPSAGAGSA